MGITKKRGKGLTAKNNNRSPKNNKKRARATIKRGASAPLYAVWRLLKSAQNLSADHFSVGSG
jgi:hypothetical protein